MLKKNIANFITLIRLIGGIAILFLEPLTAPFFIVYTLCGFTDCIDGTVARKMGSVSEFGSKLDTVADLVFYAAMMIKMLPIMWVSFHKCIFIVLGAVLLTRLIMYIAVYIKRKTLDSPHTVFNKITGVMMFLLPYAGVTRFFEAYGWVTLAVAAAAIVHQTTLEKKQYSIEK